MSPLLLFVINLELRFNANPYFGTESYTLTES